MEDKKNNKQINSMNIETKKKKNIFTKKIYIDTPLRIFVYCGFIFIFAFLSIILLKNGLKIKNYQTIYFQEKGNLDYKVYLKPNTYYPDPFLPKGQQYVASLIDYVDVNFDYNFNASNAFDYDYNYNVVADLTIYEKGDKSKLIYKKSDNLVPKTEFSKTNSNSYTISQNVKINYDYYNNIVSSFKKDYSLSLDSELKINLYIFMNGKYEKIEQPISVPQSMSLTMPLTQQTINISMNYKEADNSKIIEEYSIVEPYNIIHFVLSGVSALIAAIIAVFFVRFINKVRVKGTEYDKKLSRILKDYESIIARIKRVPDLSDGTLFELESFDEILDISERLEKPILFIEIHKHQKSWFIIINGKEIYKFALKLIDVDKAKK